MEDDNILLQSLVNKFEKSGFTVYYASDGESGLRTALDKHPDIILLDIIMPKVSGEGMFKLLRKDLWGAGVPVIVLSNIDPDGYLLDSVKECKPVAYHIKSNITLDEIYTLVKKTLNIS